MDGSGAAWLDEELFGCELADERLNKRLRRLVEQIEGAMGEKAPRYVMWRLDPFSYCCSRGCRRYPLKCRTSG